MEFDAAARAAFLVPARECGGCAVCCKVYDIHELDKPAGVWCRHCDIGRGCRIHPDRPNACREFFCLWRMDPGLPPEWRPDRARFALSLYPGNGFVYAQVDPGSPHAWRKEPYLTGLKRMAEHLLKVGRHVLVFNKTDAVLIMPSGPVPIGPMSPEDGFVVREEMTPTGPAYRVEKVGQSRPGEPKP